MNNRFQKAFTLATVVRCLGAANGSWQGAEHVAQRDYSWNKNTVETIKAAVGATGVSDLNQTYAFGQAVDNFVESLRAFSPFDAMKPSMRPMPFKTPIHGTTGVSGATVEEGEYAPVSKISLDDQALERRKASALVVLTQDAFNVEGFLPHLQRELVAAAAEATNRDFLTDLSLVAEDEASTGATAAHVLADLEAMLGHIRKRGTSSLYLIVGPDTAANLSCKHVGGLPAFPEMSPNGGTIAGLPCVVSDALPTDADGHQVLLVDADAIIFGDDGFDFGRSLSSTIRMSDDPENDVGPAEISLFQTDSTAILVNRHFGHRVMRDDAVALLTDVKW